MGTGSSFGRMIVMWITRPWTFVLFLVMLAGVFVYFAFDQARHTKKAKKLPFIAMTSPKSPGILCIFCPSTKDTTGTLLTLRGFESPEAIYEYAYKTFGEAAFEKISVYQATGEEARVFSPEPGESDDESLARFRSLLL